MEKSEGTSFEIDYPIVAKELEEQGFVEAIKRGELLEIAGIESFSVGESFSMFFKEFGMTVDRKMASLSRPVHTVDISKLRSLVKNREISFVKHSAVPITVPTNYEPGIANMMVHTKGVVEGVFLLGSLRTEASRLYDFLKKMIATGRSETKFKFTINNFEDAMEKAEHFIKELPETKTRQKVALSEVYVNFEEMLEVCDSFNSTLKMLSARDIEIVAKELSNAYRMGELLITKIKDNEISFDKNTIMDLEFTVNKFVRLTDLCGAMMTLLNELSAVLREQVKEVSVMRG